MKTETPSPKSASGKAVIALPFAWLAIFFALPFLFVLKISFSRQRDGRPPYEPVFDTSAGWSNLEEARKFSGDSYSSLLSDSLYIEAYLSSLWIAAIATLLALLIAYPLAYAMTRAPKRWQAILIVLAVAPFWTSFLIRIYAWIVILKDEGLLNQLLLSVGIISSPIQIYATQWAVVIGIVYSYLPFMILPIYNSLEKQDYALVEAAIDLGATPARAFRTITFPLSLRGVIAGCLLVFIPAVGEYVIPDLLGGSDTLMIGRTIWDEFSSARNWPGAAALAIIMLAILIVPIAIYQRTQSVGGKM
jgi:putrescine transport system permease protein